jgi:hypothetical protein
MADTRADEEIAERTGANDPVAQHDDAGGPDERVRAQLRSPLLIGCIAYAILTWMIAVVIVIYIWKLFGS